MRLPIVGKSGLLVWELSRALAPLGSELVTNRCDLNPEHVEAMRRRIRKLALDAIVNAAAYADVEEAENKPEHAQSVHGIEPGTMAEEVRQLGA